MNSKYPQYADAVARPIDLHRAVAEYRAGETRRRRLDNRPQHLLQVGAGYQLVKLARERIELALTLAGNADLVELLRSEARDRDSLATAKRHRIARPEVAARLRGTTTTIRDIVQTRGTA